MPLQCDVTCADTGITLTDAYTKVIKTTSYASNGKSDAQLAIYKDNAQAAPVFRLSCTFDTDMDSGTDTDGVNPFKACEDALVAGNANLDNTNYASTFTGATIVA